MYSKFVTQDTQLIAIRVWIWIWIQVLCYSGVKIKSWLEKDIKLVKRKTIGRNHSQNVAMMKIIEIILSGLK